MIESLQGMLDPTDLLLVDDDPTFCAVLGEALGKRGFSVRIAHNANEALALADQKTPQYAVVDLHMPGPLDSSSFRCFACAIEP